ncbi:MAG: flavin reductase, partial [Planctomycetia bacterium]|nr:flavin reductase [Planctomycetia bacterium]
SHTLFLADVTAAEVLSQVPSVTYDFYQKKIKPAPTPTKTKGWQCRICGYIHESEDLPPDFVCPICKHGAADFERIE